MACKEVDEKKSRGMRADVSGHAHAGDNLRRISDTGDPWGVPARLALRRPGRSSVHAVAPLRIACSADLSPLFFLELQPMPAPSARRLSLRAASTPTTTSGVPRAVPAMAKKFTARRARRGRTAIPRGQLLYRRWRACMRVTTAQGMWALPPLRTRYGCRRGIERRVEMVGPVSMRTRCTPAARRRAGPCGGSAASSR